MQPRAIVLGLLREPAAIRRELHQPLAQEIVDRDVGFAHRRAAVLGPALQRGLERARRERARLAHRGLEPRLSARAASAQVPATVSPSSRTVGALVP